LADIVSPHNRFADAAKNPALHAKMNLLRQKYIKSPRDTALEEAFRFLTERVASFMPNLAMDDDSADDVEGRAVAVLGQSGAGKSTALGRILASHPLLPDYGKPTCPVIGLTAPAPCTLKTLGRAILACLGYPIIADRKEHEIWEELHKRLTKMGTLIIFIDEMQNATTNAKKDEAGRIRDTLKSLLNSKTHPVCLMLAGLPELKYFLEADTQLRRRTRFVELKSLNESDIAPVKGTIAVLAKAADLTANFEGDLAARLIAAALGEFGTAIEMTLEAIEHALSSGQLILTRENYAAMFAERTGNSAPANPFVADNWRQIDCSYVLMDDTNEREEMTPPNTRGNKPGSPRNNGARRPRA
jgi:hypothetical protein